MCGIAGVYNFKKSDSVKEKDVVKMRDTLTHRGPDDLICPRTARSASEPEG
jgi:asparagine synthetase B (glutamine-hydrolysing)